MNKWFDEPYEALVLPPKAFFTPSWRPQDMVDLYCPTSPGETEIDWRRSYALHGSNTALNREPVTTEARYACVRDAYFNATVESLLRNESNYARAVMPVIQHALSRGLLKAA